LALIDYSCSAGVNQVEDRLIAEIDRDRETLAARYGISDAGAFLYRRLERAFSGV